MQVIPAILTKRQRLVALLSWILCLTFVCAPSTAQEGGTNPKLAAAPRPLLTQPVDELQLTVLKGNTHPLARPEFDLGTAPASLPMQRMLLVLKRSAEQESALSKLLDDQQDKNSASYHKWLTPEQYGQQFGPADSDLQTITGWLQSHGFEVRSSKGRTVIEFSGSASQVRETFHTSIHKYVVNGDQHWANSTDPQIPTALTAAIAGIDSLNNFPRKPMSQLFGKFSRNKSTGKLNPLSPLFTYPGGCDQDNNCYALSPYDFATIYNLLPLWNAGLSGQNQTIAIVGESNINLQDVTDFRTMFGLVANGFPANPVNVILNGPDPGPQGDESEADIDVQWSSAAAPNATIDFVVSQSTETTSGVDLSAVYIVENNLAPVMSESYGFCELGLGTAGNQFFNSLWQQAAAQGITVFIASGDDGAAGCDFNRGSTPQPAQYGFAVSGYASTPYNVAVGGTDFNDVIDPTAYWNTSNDPTTQASAKGYIPETTWNDSCTNGILASFGWSANPETNCNNSRLSQLVLTVGGSGGASTCTTPSGTTVGTCAGGYPKPSWQTRTGVPNDGKRDLPDVSLFASNGFMGNFYVICQSDQTYGTCNTNSSSYFLGFGGTSVSSPAFAGIMALVNQQMAAQGLSGRQGNANYVLYKLAAQQPTAFHDVTSGTIAMPCLKGSPNCSTTNSADQYGVMTGYNTGTGYDLATGLGSVNAQNLVMKWSSVVSLPSSTTLNTLAPTTVTHGQPVSVSVSVRPQTGSGTPTGAISLLGSASSNGGIADFTLTNGSASGSTSLLPGGSYSVTAHYPGDGTYGPSDSSPVSVIVNKENSQSQVFLVTFDSSGHIVSNNTNTAVYAAPYLLRVNVENAAGDLCAPVSTSGATGCPSGAIALTDNGAALDAGTYTLNSYGYVEDQLVQFSGGSHSVKATYAGDTSFNSNSATSAITITPAPTTMDVPWAFGYAVGQATQMSVYVNTTSSGAAPSGTVTFYANGKAIGGTISYSPRSGGPGYTAYLQANLITDNNAFPSAGNYAITATYNADANYSSSTSGADNITVIYPMPTVSATPYSQTVSYGNPVTITALVDTANKTTYPTGTITFMDYTGATVAGPTACTNATDSGGYFACKVTGTFTVRTGGTITLRYSGDNNFPASTGNAYIDMPDFALSFGGGVQLTAGQSQNVTISFQSSSGFSGTVGSFSCSGLPAETTCSFSPSQVTLPSNGNVSTTLTVTTTALGQSRKGVGVASTWGMSQAVVLLGACFLGIPLARRRGRFPVLLLLVALFMVLPSCGGGNSGGGGGGNPNPVPIISSLSPAQIAAGSEIQNLYVNGTNFMSSSTVTYNGTLHNSSLQSSTQLQIALGPNDVATTGQYPVIVINPSPGGGPSAATNFAVMTGTPTGNFDITVTATSGAITHSATVGMTVQ